MGWPIAIWSLFSDRDKENPPTRGQESLAKLLCLDRGQESADSGPRLHPPQRIYLRAGMSDNGGCSLRVGSAIALATHLFRRPIPSRTRRAKASGVAPSPLRRSQLARRRQKEVFCQGARNARDVALLGAGASFPATGQRPDTAQGSIAGFGACEISRLTTSNLGGEIPCVRKRLPALSSTRNT